MVNPCLTSPLSYGTYFVLYVKGAQIAQKTRNHLKIIDGPECWQEDSSTLRNHKP